MRLVQLWQNLQQVLLSVDRIGDILNVSPEAELGTGLVLPPLKGQVTFEQVFFRYRPNFEAILRESLSMPNQGNLSALSDVAVLGKVPCLNYCNVSIKLNQDAFLLMVLI